MSNVVRKKSETNFRSNQVRPFLKKLKKCVIFPIQQTAIKGHPDFILCLNGYFVSLELKGKKGKASPLQSYYTKRIESCGGYSFIVDSNNWEYIKAKLVAIDEGDLLNANRID